MLQSLLEFLRAQMNTNQFAMGGVVLMALGSVLAVVRGVPGRVWRIARNRLVVRVEVTSDTPQYEWLHLWLLQHPYSQRVRNVQLGDMSGAFSGRNHRGQSFLRTRDEEAALDLSGLKVLLLGEGTHFFWVHRRPVWISVSKEHRTGGNGQIFTHTLVLKSLGRGREWINVLVQEAYTLYKATQVKESGVFMYNSRDEFWYRRDFPLRKLDSLIFDASVIRDVVADAQRFHADEVRYQALQVPYRRGYLFYGPPGTGKTSLAMALAAELGRDLYIMALGGTLLTDEDLGRMLDSLGPKAVVLIEDIDGVFEGRVKKANNAVTFSGLLNVLDGVLSQTGQVLVMTTNHREHLDPALARPGRIDVQVEIGPSSAAQARAIFLRFFPDHPDMAEVFAPIGTGYSMAVLQEHLLRHDHDPWMAAHTPPQLETKDADAA